MSRNLFAFFLSVLANLASAQCPTGDVIISSAADLNNYAIQYANCDTLPGDLIISDPQTSIDLTVFSDLNMISGDLHLQAIPPGAPDLTGFDQLSHIGGDLFMNGLPPISLNGLGALQRIDGDLLIQFAGITSFTGLSSLSVIGGDLEVIFAPLTSLNGLVQLDSIYGDLTIKDGIEDPGFTLISLPNDLEYVGGSVHVESLYGTTITGGAALDRIGGDLHIHGPALGSVSGLNNLNVIGGSLDLNFLPVFTTINAFNGLDTIHASFFMYQTPMLAQLSGFPELEVIGSSMWITGNSLTTISGFGQLTSIGTLQLAGCPMLNNIAAFDHAIALEHLVLEDNPALSYCHVQAVCDHLSPDPPIVADIVNNATGCNSAAEVLSFCDFTTGIGSDSFGTAALYPNPSQDRLYVQSAFPIELIRIIGINGKAIEMGSPATQWIDVSNLAEGAYILELYHSDHQKRMMFMKRY